MVFLSFIHSVSDSDSIYHSLSSLFHFSYNFHFDFNATTTAAAATVTTHTHFLCVCVQNAVGRILWICIENNWIVIKSFRYGQFFNIFCFQLLLLRSFRSFFIRHTIDEVFGGHQSLAAVFMATDWMHYDVISLSLFLSVVVESDLNWKAIVWNRRVLRSNDSSWMFFLHFFYFFEYFFFLDFAKGSNNRPRRWPMTQISCAS